MQKSQHKILSLLLVIALLALPMFSAFSATTHCDMNPDSSAMLEMQQNDNSLLDSDCCEKTTQTCSHYGECDCENAQSGASLLGVDKVGLTLSPLEKPTPLYNVLKSHEITDSLYRPPITLL